MIISKLRGVANINRTNPQEAKSSILVNIYPNRQMFAEMNEIQNDILPTASISLLSISKILSLS